MKRWLLALFGSWLVLPVVARAQQTDALRADRKEPTTQESREFRPGLGGAFTAGRGQGNFDRPTPEERQMIMDFWKDHSPKRYEAFQKLERGRRFAAGAVMVQQYRQLQRLKEMDPKAYEVGLKEKAVEDEIFDLTRQWRAGDAKGDVRQQLRVKFGTLLDLRLQEREMRIKHWSDQIENTRARLQDLQEKFEKEKKLAQDEKANREKMVERRLKQSEKEAGLLGDENAEATTKEPTREDKPTSASSSIE